MSSLIVLDGDKDFKEVVNLILGQWEIIEPTDVALVQRMASCWMKIKESESALKRQGLWFEVRNKDGELTGTRMNQVAYYLKQLEAEFKGYYRLLNDKYGKISDDGEVKDFFGMLESKEVKKPKKKTKSGQKGGRGGKKGKK